MSFRTYHEVQGDDRSGLGRQVAAQRERVRARLDGVRRVVAVMSGKGGVGKSHVTALLARALAGRGAVGVLDGDFASPTVARLLEARGPLRMEAEGVHPADARDGVRVFSMDLLLGEGDPLRWREPASERFVWRGALEAGALREFLGDVVWGPLDWLLVDLPPGGDRLDDLVDLVPDLAGVVAVTIPSEESERSVRRSLQAARERGLALLGVIENMSGYACGDCGRVGPLFPGDAGPRLAADFDVPLLARLPFAPGVSCPPDLIDRFLEAAG